MDSNTIKDDWKENKLFISRLIILSVVTIFFAILLIVQLYKLQIVDYQEFSDLSQGNRLKFMPLAPTRGLIKDRNGIILADNIPNWELVLIPEEVNDLDFTLDRLIGLKLIDELNKPRLKQLITSQRQFEPIVISDLSDDQLAIFSVRRHQFPGVSIREGLARYYPHNKLAAHAIGYVSSISVDELKIIDVSSYAATSVIGKIGIEKSYENQLFGSSGYHHEIVNAQGRVFQEELYPGVPSLTQEFNIEFPYKLPEPGKNIITSIDFNLQRVAENAMGDLRGAVVVLNSNTGDILSIVSSPSYDLNLLAQGASLEDFSQLSNNANKPLFNRALLGTYPPGSIVKPFLGLGALDSNLIDENTRPVCSGFFILPNEDHRYRDWKISGHGPVNLHQAIVESCDVFFYELAVNMGIEGINNYLRLFGFGDNLDLDFSINAEGLVPSRQWKEKNFNNFSDKIWYPGETVITGIGQGFALATPIQIAYANSIIANKGIGVKPRLIIGYEDNKTGEIELIPRENNKIIDIKDEHWDYIREAMRGVVVDQRGTSFSVLDGVNYSVAGKTGTVQVFSIGQDELYEEEELAEHLRDHGIFMAFAPYDKPEISISVIVENMGSSSLHAVPIAREILDYYFNENKLN
tara:strand:+ start:5539 stop:7443 length:1905 start_codon:yes stop_codon:yes gene_type:complete